MQISKYRKERVSLRERESLSRMYSALYSKRNIPMIKDRDEMAKQSNVAVNSTNPMVGWTDRAGNDRVEKVTNFQDTREYVENATLWPDLHQFEQDDILGRNIILLEAVRLTKGQYGPYFACHIQLETPINGVHQGSWLCGGEVVNEWVSKLTGIEVATGRKIEGKTSSLPVRFRVIEVSGGDYTYFNVVPPVEGELAEADDSDE